MKDLEAQEISQWKTQSDPDPDKRMPQHVFKILNEQLLKEKEEVRVALCKAYESVPKPVDYKTKILKFADAISALEDPDVSAKIKNQYLRDIIERIEYERPAPVRITKENASKYNTTTSKGMKFHLEPYKISIALKP
jgi:hypothetical protein